MQETCTPQPLYTEFNVFDALKDKVRTASSQVALAREWHMSIQYLNDVLHRRRPLSPKIVSLLGFHELPRRFIRRDESADPQGARTVFGVGP